jgi:iron complex outermembrane receptor protein
MISAALFQIDQTNTKSSDATHLGYWKQTGKLRSQGLDLQAMIAFTKDLNFIAGYTYLDSEVTQDTLYQGKSPTQTSTNSASVWIDYRLPSGLRFGSGVRYLGSTWGNPTNTFKVPSVTLFDLAASYDLNELTGHDATLSANVTNLANKHYISSCTSEKYCFIGQDRTINATLTYWW